MSKFCNEKYISNAKQAIKCKVEKIYIGVRVAIELTETTDCKATDILDVFKKNFALKPFLVVKNIANFTVIFISNSHIQLFQLFLTGYKIKRIIL